MLIFNQIISALRSKEILFVCSLWMTLGFNLYGKNYNFSPNSKEIPLLKQGDTLTLKAGIYRKPLSFKHLKGTKNNPIVIRSAKPGKAIFRGDEIIKIHWIEKEEGLFVGKTSKHPHMLFNSKERIKHAFRDEEFNDSRSVYRVTRLHNNWQIEFRPKSGKIEGQFSRGVIERMFSFIQCRHVLLEGISIQNTGPEKAPTKHGGLKIFGGDVLKIMSSENITVKNVTLDGWMGTGFNTNKSSFVHYKNCKLKNGYGRGISILSNYTGTPTNYNVNNSIEYCEVSEVRRFEIDQMGYSVEALSINGNSLKNTVIKNNYIHDLGYSAAGIHFDVRFKDALVEGNLFFNNNGGKSSEIDMENRIENITIRNNLFVNSNYEKTIKIERCLNINVHNNLIYKGGKSPIDIFGAYNWAIKGNIIYNPGKAILSISEQALHKEKVDRGLITMDGKNLYHVLKKHVKDPEVLNDRLIWAGVSPVNKDGSYPNDISWKSSEEMVSMGYNKKQFMSARKNPNGNGVDIDPPLSIKNSIVNNYFYSQNQEDPIYYYVASQSSAHHLKGSPDKELSYILTQNKNWVGNQLEMPEFANSQEYDFRQKNRGIGPTEKYLTFWKKVMLRSAKRTKQ